MRIICIVFFLLACGNEPKESAITPPEKMDTATRPVPNIAPADTDYNFVKDTTTDVVPAAPIVKKPSGIYRFFMPYEEDKNVLHTVAFYPTTYRLQEEYPGKQDSVVVTEGTWAPSEGAIWLYRDQIVRARYTWKEDTLQYYSPRLRQRFSLEKLTPAIVNTVWQAKKKEGSFLYGVGTEPFWSVEVNKQDSIVLNMPDWDAPLQVGLTSSDIGKDSAVYTATGDSLHITVYPFFCSDGMSDFLYTRRVKMVYKGKTYHGCGEMLRQAH